MSPRILIIDDEENMRNMLKDLLELEGYDIVISPSGEDAINILNKRDFEFILCDIKMPNMDGIEFLRKIKNMGIDSTIIMMSAYGTVDLALECIKLGAYDYISKPFKPDEIVLTLKKAEERERLKRENIYLKKEINKRYGFDNIIAKSKSMKEIFRVIEKIAYFNTPVLITGESGTGKELIARAIHYNSPRNTNQFIPINCGAIPSNLLESELFGYVKGAFTDAKTDKKGLFEEADKGTILLDEIGDMPFSLQVKLLRVIEENEIRKVGDIKTRRIDVRILAATSKDLLKEVKNGNFREDLFYRLNIIPINIPPLRERKEDIPILVKHFIEKFNEKFDKDIMDVTDRVMDLFMNYSWPGNVRELENVIERSMILTPSNMIDVDSLSNDIRDLKLSSSNDISLKRGIRNLEIELIKKALDITKGNRTHAAKLLEISHRTLLYKIKEYGL
jgi:two-component system response regulator AtoC